MVNFHHFDYKLIVVLKKLENFNRFATDINLAYGKQNIENKNHITQQVQALAFV